MIEALAGALIGALATLGGMAYKERRQPFTGLSMGWKIARCKNEAARAALDVPKRFLYKIAPEEQVVASRTFGALCVRKGDLVLAPLDLGEAELGYRWVLTPQQFHALCENE